MTEVTQEANMGKAPITFEISSKDPGAAKALRMMAATARATDLARAQMLQAQAEAFEAWTEAQRRPGAGFVPKA